MKTGLGLLLCFAIGAACQYFEVPVPAPPALVGALLVVAMSAGYNLADRIVARRPRSTRDLCAGPTGVTRTDAGKGKGEPHG